MLHVFWLFGDNCTHHLRRRRVQEGMERYEMEGVEV